MVFVTNAMAQDSKFVGTWTGTYISRSDNVKRTIIMRIKEIDNTYQIRIKKCKTDDMNDCYDSDCFGIENYGDSLRWYNKSYVAFDEEETDGAVCVIIKHFSYAKYTGGSIHYICNNYWSWERIDKNGNVVNSYNGINNVAPQIIDEAILYKDDDKW